MNKKPPIETKFFVSGLSAEERRRAFFDFLDAIFEEKADGEYKQNKNENNYGDDTTTNY